MDLIVKIQEGVAAAVKKLYDLEIAPTAVNLSPTRKEFEGDYTVVVFPFTKAAKKPPPAIAQELGEYLDENVDIISKFNIVKGFLNISVSDTFWKEFLTQNADNQCFGKGAATGKKVMVEFSSPNTNKPLHLGHIRNILLGWASAKIQEAAGNEVVKVQIINDRGIAICKSMLAWLQHGDGETPESAGVKGDHFVGKFYVEFEKHFQAEYKLWQESEQGKEQFLTDSKEGQTEEKFFKGYKNKYFNQYSAVGKEAREMLQKWEAGDEETVGLWKKMNGWVYSGFGSTYENMGVNFDKLYYESDTYLLGKELIERGLESKIFFKKEDGSVWIDLTDVKMDQKILLRSDGTSVYMTQDLGTANQRYKDFGVDSMVYTVADEQDYHFKVLFEIMKRLGEPYAENMYHLSYGMVDLTTGKMKSREGTVVDADDLMADVVAAARQNAVERGELEDSTAEERTEIYRRIGMAALKYFILKVGPRKRMTFDPNESVDLQGQTGPYVQNAYVRIQSVLRKAKTEPMDLSLAAKYDSIAEREKDIVNLLYQYPELIQDAAKNYDPSMIASYCYNLARGYHRFWHDHQILNAESEEAKAFRLQLSTFVGNTLRSAMDLLGIEMPERM